MKMFETNRVLTNAFLVVGSLGMMGLLLMLSFDWYWNELGSISTGGIGFYFALIFTLLTATLLVLLLRSKPVAEVNLKVFAFLLFIAIFLLGVESPGAAQLSVNLAILVFAIYTIRDGALKNHLGILNYGLLIITGLIACRFFDTNFSFVLRGLLFIGVGVGFFAANIYMIKKRKQGA